MLSSQLLDSLRSKKFYRFTGSPEHWLTAIQNYTWGLKLDLLKRWQRIEVGDVFLMHSTRKSRYKSAKSAIIGLGIIGPGFRQKDVFLWQDEFEQNENTYRLLVPFSEIYLFSSVENIDEWNFNNIQLTKSLIEKLLSNSVPLPKGFPQMGSFSEVQDEVAMQVLKRGLPEFLRESPFSIDSYREAVTPLLKIKNSSESMRYIPTLKHLTLSDSQERRLEKKYSNYERDNELLERANNVHRRIIDNAIGILNASGYDTLSNMHADLVAENESSILLLEAKSIPDGRFRSQARTAIGQLFQYEFFDIKDYQQKNDTAKPVQKILLIPDDPCDNDYINFLSKISIQSRIADKSKFFILE